MKIYKQHKLLLIPFQLEILAQPLNLEVKEQRIRFGKDLIDWGVLKDYFGKGTVPYMCGQNNKRKYFKLDLKNKQFYPNTNDPHYHFTNATIFCSGRPFSDNDPIFRSGYVGLIALVLMHENGQVQFANNQPLDLPKGQYLAFLPALYGSGYYPNYTDTALVWEADGDDDVYYLIDLDYYDSKFYLSSDGSNNYNSNFPIVNLIYKNGLTKEEQAKEDNRCLCFSNLDDFIKKAWETGLIWEEENEEEILDFIRTVEDQSKSPLSCVKLLSLPNSSAKTSLIKQVGGLEEIIKICGIKEERLEHNIRFILFEKINGSLLLDGDDFYYSLELSLIEVLLKECGIKGYNRERFSIPADNDVLELCTPS